MVRAHPGPQVLMVNKKWIHLSKEEKLQQLKALRDEYRLIINELYKNFRGVKHENSLSELRFSEIKVKEDMLGSVLREIKALEENIE